MRKGLRIALVVLAMNCIWFFRGGCQTQMTLGFPAPLVAVKTGQDEVQTPAGGVNVTVPTTIVSWSAWNLVVDALFLLVMAAWLWRRGGIAPTPWGCFWLATTILNSFLVPFVGVYIWFYCVLWPTALLFEAVHAVLLRDNLASEWKDLADDIASRLYFVLLFFACWGLTVFGGWVFRKFNPVRADTAADELIGEELRPTTPSPLAPG